MAMNFWEAQKKARSRTSLYVSLFILLTALVATLVEFAMRHFAAPNYDPPYPLLGLIFMVVTFAVAGYQYSMYQAFGGSYVAESVGAQRIDPQTANFQERQLLHIVEEIALAAGLPMPAVYILPAKGINAFAAGTAPENAAITVTTGSLQALNRDELQGVVAHEFGHIYNRDMNISMRLAAMVMGFFFVLYIALRILQFAPREREEDNKRGGNPLIIAALILLCAGALTWLFGSLLKASVSREREYLADACAVQFTRNPHGIGNALRKIAQEQNSRMPSKGMAYSHLYLNDEGGLSALFATHPPLRKRIAAIEGKTYIPEEWNIPTS